MDVLKEHSELDGQLIVGKDPLQPVKGLTTLQLHHNAVLSTLNSHSRKPTPYHICLYAVQEARLTSCPANRLQISIHIQILHRISSNIVARLSQGHQRSDYTHHAYSMSDSFRFPQVVASHHQIQYTPQQLNRSSSHLFLPLNPTLLFYVAIFSLLLGLWAVLDEVHQLYQIVNCSEQVLQQIHKHASGFVLYSHILWQYLQLTQQNQVITQIKQYLTYLLQYFYSLSYLRIAIFACSKLPPQSPYLHQQFNPCKKSQPFSGASDVRIGREGSSLVEVLFGVNSCVLNYSEDLNRG